MILAYLFHLILMSIRKWKEKKIEISFFFFLNLLLIEPYTRRVLRPRTEPKSYAEAPDIVLLPAKINGRQQNGNIDSDTDDEEMPPIIAIKVINILITH